jgi:hypothetical protein
MLLAPGQADVDKELPAAGSGRRRRMASSFSAQHVGDESRSGTVHRLSSVAPIGLPLKSSISGPRTGLFMSRLHVLLPKMTG